MDTVRQAAEAIRRNMILYRNPYYPASGLAPERYALSATEYEEIARTVLDAVGYDALCEGLRKVEALGHAEHCNRANSVSHQHSERAFCSCHMNNVRAALDRANAPTEKG